MEGLGHPLDPWLVTATVIHGTSANASTVGNNTVAFVGGYSTFKGTLYLFLVEFQYTI